MIKHNSDDNADNVDDGGIDENGIMMTSQEKDGDDHKGEDTVVLKD